VEKRIIKKPPRKKFFAGVYFLEIEVCFAWFFFNHKNYLKILLYILKIAS